MLLRRVWLSNRLSSPGVWDNLLVADERKTEVGTSTPQLKAFEDAWASASSDGLTDAAR